jgi:hypothetical protein
MDADEPNNPFLGRTLISEYSSNITFYNLFECIIFTGATKIEEQGVTVILSKAKELPWI